MITKLVPQWMFQVPLGNELAKDRYLSMASVIRDHSYRIITKYFPVKFTIATAHGVNPTK